MRTVPTVSASAAEGRYGETSPKLANSTPASEGGRRVQVPRVPVLLLALVVGPLVVHAEQWPQFRGPGALGVAESAKLPETWSTTKNVRWKTAIPGHGWS